MATAKLTTKLTLEDYLAMPERQGRWEILEGELIVSPAPNVQHQFSVLNIARLLEAHVVPLNPGFVVIAPCDVLIRRDPLQVRQPDVLYISYERSGISGREEAKGIGILEVAPDLVIEVLSPSNTRSQVEEKLQDYCEIGVLECWIACNQEKTIEVLELDHSGIRSASKFRHDDVIRSLVLPELSFTVERVYV